MEILEALELTGTLRGAAEPAGCDRKTVAHWVRAREESAAGCRCPVGRGRGLTGSRRRSRSECIARAGGSARTCAISGWSRWGTWVQSARRAGDRRAQATLASGARPARQAVMATAASRPERPCRPPPARCAGAPSTSTRGRSSWLPARAPAGLRGRRSGEIARVPRCDVDADAHRLRASRRTPSRPRGRRTAGAARLPPGRAERARTGRRGRRGLA